MLTKENACPGVERASFQVFHGAGLFLFSVKILHCVNLSDYLTWNSLDKLREGSVCENLAEAVQSEVTRC